MFRIFPMCYHMESDWNSKEKRYEIILNFPQDENTNNSCSIGSHFSSIELKKRKENFKQQALEILKYAHNKFLLNLEPPVSNYDYESQCFWHHLWDVESFSEENLPELDKN